MYLSAVTTAKARLDRAQSDFEAICLQAYDEGWSLRDIATAAGYRSHSQMSVLKERRQKRGAAPPL